MNNRLTIKVVSVVAILGIVAMAGYAFAYDGYGRGQQRGGWGMNVPQDCPAWGKGAGKGRGANLSQEDAQKLQDMRQAFFEATRDLRGALYQKDLELRSELAKAEPDVNRAASIQAELSTLRSELDQKRLAHRIEMKKNFPDAGPMMGYGHGKGRGGKRGGGHGPGQGSCWQ